MSTLVCLSCNLGGRACQESSVGEKQSPWSDRRALLSVGERQNPWSDRRALLLGCSELWPCPPVCGVVTMVGGGLAVFCRP